LKRKVAARVIEEYFTCNKGPELNRCRGREKSAGRKTNRRKIMKKEGLGPQRTAQEKAWARTIHLGLL